MAKRMLTFRYIRSQLPQIALIVLGYAGPLTVLGAFLVALFLAELESQWLWTVGVVVGVTQEPSGGKYA